LRLTALVGVRQRFLRSVNLERDFYSEDALQGYVPTPAALSALERIAEGIRNPNARAYSLTGAYGTGKSAFALFAAKTLAGGKVGDAALRREARRQSAVLNTTLLKA
jgi:predicted NACHT family NTPase